MDDSTRRSYGSHVRTHLIPYLGDVVLDKLRPHHVQTLMRKIRERNDEITAMRNSADPMVRFGAAGLRPTGEATRGRIRATLRKAFNDALRLGIIAGVANPAALFKTPNPRPKPIVWEPERVARWRATGIVPGPIMVWTDQIVADFLDHAAEHAPDLHPLLHFLAYRGPRRGEACGLLDSEVRLDQAEVSIVNQIAAHGRNTYYKKPKSESGNRDVILDADTVAVFTCYKAQRARWQLAAGPNWPDTGLFFVRRDGTAWHPDSVSALPPPHPQGRLPTGATARSAPQRGHHRAASGRGHQSRVRTARSLHHHADPRHLPKRHEGTAPRSRPRRRRPHPSQAQTRHHSLSLVAAAEMQVPVPAIASTAGRRPAPGLAQRSRSR